jgi:CHAD domain-containing protein
MPYRFKINEPVEKGFRRIAREQFDASSAELAGPNVGAKNVHECRKSLKRLRALVRIAAGAIGHGKAQRRNKSLGGIAKLLSDRRDQTVMLDTIAKLSLENADTASALAPLGAGIAQQDAHQPETLAQDIATRARALLAREALKLERAEFSKRGFAALADGLEASYRHGRKAGKYAYEEPTDENFHELRKAVQWHWRQMSLLSKAWPDEFAVRVNAARELSQQLGDDHDLAMLVDAALRSATMSDEQKDAAIQVCRRRQQSLRMSAEYRVKRLFAEKPRAFVGRVAAYWRCSRSLDSRLEVPLAPRQVGVADQLKTGLADLDVPATDKRQTPVKPRLAVKSEAQATSQRRA